MNKDNAHEYLPLVQALADGKTIQIKATEWEDFEEHENIEFDADPSNYRIKPEPRKFEILVNTTLHSSYDWERITVQDVL